MPSIPIIVLLVIIYLSIGSFLALIAKNYFNLRFKKNNRRSTLNDSGYREWHNETELIFLVSGLVIVWPLIILGYGIAKPAKYSYHKLNDAAEYIAKEAVSPKENTPRKEF